MYQKFLIAQKSIDFLNAMVFNIWEIIIFEFFYKNYAYFLKK